MAIVDTEAILEFLKERYHDLEDFLIDFFNVLDEEEIEHIAEELGWSKEDDSEFFE